MDIQTILKVLKNERECIKRQGTAKCDRNCKECDLCLPDEEILAVYDHLIATFIMEEDENAYIINEVAKAHFNGICPYTNKKCDAWTCGICEVEERERKFMEDEDIE